MRPGRRFGQRPPSPRGRRAARRSLVSRLLGLVALMMVSAALNAAGLAARVDRAIEEERLVGATWALVSPAGTTLGAAGWNDARTRRRMLPGDRVHVGSITKTLLATGVLQLVTAGRIGLDDRVDQYLAGVRIDNPWHASAPLRIRHLLDHTGGLDDARLWQVFSRRAHIDTPLVQSVGGNGAVIAVRHRPGERASYSNTGYVLLAMVVEQVTATRYEAWLDAQLLRPLGMVDSTFGFVTQHGRLRDPRLAMGHFDPQTPAATIPTYLRPAVQFTTTAADMARFARFLMSDGVVDGRILVHGDLLRAMGVPAGTEAARSGLATGFALGLVRRDRHGLAGECHLGNMGTFRAALCLYPQHGRAFFIAYNSDPEGGDFDRVDALLVRAVGLDPVEPARPEAPAVDPAQWQGWYLPQPNRFAQFAYLDALTGATRVQWTGRSLVLRALQGDARRLAPVGGALFRARDRTEASHVLIRSVDGGLVISDGSRTLARQRAAGLYVRWLGALLGVAGLAYLLTAGTVRTFRAWRRRGWSAEPLRWPTAGAWFVTATPLAFLGQSAVALGDPSMPNLMLTAVTAALPLALAIGLYHRLKAGLRDGWARVDCLALFASVQWCVTLAFAGLLPLALWR